MMDDKKKQHYVWRHYLSQWAEKDQIWCLRENQIFKTALMNIAQERYFYKSSMLTIHEEKLILGLINKINPHDHIRLMCLSCYEVYKSTAMYYNQHYMCNGIEEYHTQIESKAKKSLELLYKKSLSFIDTEQTKKDFCHFLGVQYTRTKRMREAFIKSIPDVEKTFPQYAEKFDFLKINSVMSIIYGALIGNVIYDKLYFSFVESFAETCFITGDQPIFNLDAINIEAGKEIEKLNLYYPLTPRLSLLLTSEKRDNSIVSEDEVQKYNSAVFKSSHNMIFSHNKDLLSKYKNELPIVDG